MWIPKYRLFIGEMKKIIAELCGIKGIEIVEGAICYDHIHMCVKIPPKYSVSEVMGYLKGKSALRIWEKHPEWKREGHGKEFWARGKVKHGRTKLEHGEKIHSRAGRQ